jgi:Fe-S-cluster containining protein
MDDQVKLAKPCSRCGKCCTSSSYMGTLSATEEDVHRWIREKRWDILAWTWLFYDRDGIPDCADLWVSPKTGIEAERCPFVRKERGRNTYKCTIYDTRPEVCRDYEPWAPGTICEDVND